MYIYTKEMFDYIRSNFCLWVTLPLKSFYNVKIHVLGTVNN